MSVLSRSKKKLSIKAQRAAAEKRSMELLRAHVPDEEWHRGPVFGTKGYGLADYIEFQSQLGSTYQIWMHSTVENIIHIAGPRGGTFREGHRRLCAGPYSHNDYLLPHQVEGRPQMDFEAWGRARQQAAVEGTYPLTLPPGDIWLGQYLSLKYDEKAFLVKARASTIYA